MSRNVSGVAGLRLRERAMVARGMSSSDEIVESFPAVSASEEAAGGSAAVDRAGASVVPFSSLAFRKLLDFLAVLSLSTRLCSAIELCEGPFELEPGANEAD